MAEYVWILGPAQLGILKCFMISRLSKFMWSRPLPSLHLDHPDQLRLLQRLLLVLQLRLHHVDVRLQSRQILLQAFQCFTHSKVYKCNQCEYETRRASSLRLHKKMHPGEKTHRCTLCDFSGITSGKLKVYMMRKHIREKPYKCKQCNYACPVSGDLQQHMKTHTVERPFKCNQCNKTYKIKGDLTRHCRAHQTSD